MLISPYWFRICTESLSKICLNTLASNKTFKRIKFGYTPSGNQAFLLRSQKHSISLPEEANFRKESCKSNILGLCRSFIYIKPWSGKHLGRFAKEVQSSWIISRSFIMIYGSGKKAVFASNEALSWLVTEAVRL